MAFSIYDTSDGIESDIRDEHPTREALNIGIGTII